MEPLVQNMRTLLQDYMYLRGRSCRSTSQPMWDMVVITTADSPQQEAFEAQLEDKKARNELPLDLPIYVVADPPGGRIGNGGSTLVALEFLYHKFGDSVYQKKILLIHAGGWSQRMPSATVLGKIFSAIPHGEPVFQMLDLKLALYWPFVSFLSPGVFLLCADDLLVYDLGHDMDWRIPSNGFTALAHPSPVKIGETHGVYVLNKVDTRRHVIITQCLEVLQKPSSEIMRNKGALLQAPDGHFEFADGIAMDGEIVYTDSCFYFGVDVMRKFIDLKSRIGAISCEIDAYGDFLQALGARASDSYIYNTCNISHLTPNLTQVRKEVFDTLAGTDIHVMVLNASKFIHIGTTKELIYHFCQDDKFQKEMALQRNVFNKWEVIGDSLSQSIACKGCVMHSVLPSTSTIENSCVIEYCHFDIPVVIENNSIISNCQWLRSVSANSKTELLFPGNTFFHTVSVKFEGSSYFVTVFFAVSDNLKTSLSSTTFDELPFLNKRLGIALQIWQILKGDVLPDKDSKISLWNVKLYPGLSTMTSSLQLALEMVNSIHNECALSQPLKRFGPIFSLDDVLAYKDITTMLDFRRQLFEIIQMGRTRNSD